MELKDFDKIVCVCVDQRRNEWRQLEEQIKARGAHMERFVVGKGKILHASRYDMIDPEDLPEGLNWYGFTKNAYCCYLSHRKIIESAKADGLKNILLLEDDCQLLDNFDDISEKASEQIEDLKLAWDTFTFGQNLKWGKADQVSPNVLKLNYGVYCWHAIAINQAHNDMFQHFLDLPPRGAFDFLWSRYTQPKFNCYGIWPNVAIQKPGVSYVLNQMTDYTGWLKETGENNIDPYTL